MRSILLTGIFFFLMRKFRPSISLFVWLFSTILLAGSRRFGSTAYPALVWAVFSILTIDQYYRSGKDYWILAAGLLVGITFWYRWDFGIYACIGNFTSLLLFHRHFQIKSNQSVNQFITKSIILMAGVIIAIIPLFLLIYGHGVLGKFMDQAILFPATQMRNFRWKPYPSIITPFLLIFDNGSMVNKNIFDLFDWFYFYFPLMLLGLYSKWFISVLHQKISDRQIYGWIALGILGFSLIIYSMSRFDYQHALPVSLFCLPLSILLIKPQESRYTIQQPTTKFPFMFFLVIVAYTIIPIIFLSNSIYSFSPFKCFSNFSNSKCVYLDQDQRQLISFITSSTKDNDPIFIGNSRHDKIHVNDISLYFLIGRPGGSSYFELHPGVATTYAVQSEIISEIEEKNVDWIIVVDLPISTEPNQSSISSQVFLLDNFINKQYRRVKTFGRYTVLHVVP